MTITKEELKKFARYDITADELFFGHDKSEATEEYSITLDDIKAALKKLSTMRGHFEYDFFSQWLVHISSYSNLGETLKTPQYLVHNNLAKISEDGLLRNDIDAMYNVIERLYRYFYTFDEATDKIDFQPLIDAIACYEANKAKPFTAWNFPDEIKDAYVRYINGKLKAEEAVSDDQITLFQRYIEELIASGNTAAIRLKGDLLTHGSPIYASDKASQIENLQKVFDLSGDPETAYFLGNYYYDKQEFSKSFSFYTYGNLMNHFDSSIKLANMYKNGIGTIKNIHAYEEIIRQSYERERKNFCQAKYNTRFTEAAYLFGQMLEGSTEFPGADYYHYLEAEYVNTFTPNEALAKDIASAIKRTKKNVKQKKGSVITRSIDDFLAELFEGGYTCVFNAEKETNGYCLRLSRLNSTAPKILLIYPEYGYCNLTSEIVLHIKTDKELLDDVLFDNFDVETDEETEEASIVLCLDTNPLVALPEKAKFYIKDNQ